MKKKQREEAADNDGDSESASVDEEEVDGAERDVRAGEGEENAKPAVIKDLLQRMMVGKISAKEAETVGRDFFDRVAAMDVEGA